MTTQIKQLKNLQYLDNLKSGETAIVLFHGYGASMQDLYGISNYIEGRYDWFFPNGPVSVPLGFMMEGRAWFPIDMQELEAAMNSGRHRVFRDKRSDIFDRSQSMALDFLNELKPKYKRIIIGGFSQGAMLASHVFSQAKVDGLVLFSGTLIDAKELGKKLSDGASLKFLQTHGKSDQMLSFAQAKDLHQFMLEHDHLGEFVEFEGGHEIPETALSKFASYLKQVDEQR